MDVLLPSARNHEEDVDKNRKLQNEREALVSRSRISISIHFARGSPNAFRVKEKSAAMNYTKKFEPCHSLSEAGHPPLRIVET